MVLVKDIMQTMEAWAPQALRESWDNTGLQVGDPNQQVKRVLLALSPTGDVIQEAVDCGVQLLLTHHPLIFKGPQSLRTDTAIGKHVSALIKADIAHFCAHTNLDITDGGVNDALAQCLELIDVAPLVATGGKTFYKLVAFVPTEHIENVREALFHAGAGQQGDYSGCSWTVQGTGSFQPMAGAQPHIGAVGEVSKVQEYRLEVLVSEDDLQQVQDALRATHPYEEIAYDVFEEVHMREIFGIGRIGTIQTASCLGELLADWKKQLNLSDLRYHGDLNRPVRRVALCGGSAAGYLAQAAQAGADVYLTGDVRYHDAQLAQELGMALVDGGHYGTERPVLAHIQKTLSAAFPAVQFDVSEVEKDLIQRV